MALSTKILTLAGTLSLLCAAFFAWRYANWQRAHRAEDQIVAWVKQRQGFVAYTVSADGRLVRREYPFARVM